MDGFLCLIIFIILDDNTYGDSNKILLYPFIKHLSKRTKVARIFSLKPRRVASFPTIHLNTSFQKYKRVIITQHKKNHSFNSIGSPTCVLARALCCRYSSIDIVVKRFGMDK